MTPAPLSAPRRSSRVRLAVGVAIAAGAAALILANAHLVYVAIASSPDCVAHVKDRGDPSLGVFRAARPSC